jgi:hypothetical protein
MIRKPLAVLVIALALPGLALAAKPKAAPKLKTGMACTSKKEAYYKAHHFTCAKGHLKPLKHKTT